MARKHLHSCSNKRHRPTSSGAVKTEEFSVALLYNTNGLKWSNTATKYGRVSSMGNEDSKLECIWRMGNMMRGVCARDKIDTQNHVSSQKRKENYVPNNHVAKVFHGWLFEGVERQKAEELLLLPANRGGSFLVRENTRERGTYSLSVKHRIIQHYRIFRLENSWYYISPRLTFQCLEDMINHYSDSADGLCCALTSPCLSGTTPQADCAPPVAMRRNFDWKKVDRRQLVSTDSCSDNGVSYGVRNSIAAYLSFSENQQHAQTRAKSRKKKSKSVYALPDNSFANNDYDDDL
ncbi:hypothetical protein F2P81_023560 [Scophthalmus maximus]|uniref:SH2 domain-containing protein n=1 Tax=Scophthalmus maximus TaxID=52904 RepID=A0A6A4RXV2_SCOMX|nr:hypothetical protein F2P81_023560 [Scophthalmus maximus]